MATSYAELQDCFPILEWRRALQCFAPSNPVPWDTDLVVYKFFLGDRVISEEVVDTFFSYGWLLHSFRAYGVTAVSLTPVVHVDPPSLCFHTSPVNYLPSILRRGLLPGCIVGHSTTTWPGAEWFIHVSLTEEAAKQWAKQELLGKAGAYNQWAILAVDTSDLRICRDPASHTGYIVEAKHVPAKALAHLLSPRWLMEPTCYTESSAA